jgi:hypothetical protein
MQPTQLKPKNRIISRHVWVSNFQDWIKKEILNINLNINFSFSNSRNFWTAASALHAVITSKGIDIFFMWKEDEPPPPPTHKGELISFDFLLFCRSEYIDMGHQLRSYKAAWSNIRGTKQKGSSPIHSLEILCQQESLNTRLASHVKKRNIGVKENNVSQSTRCHSNGSYFKTVVIKHAKQLWRVKKVYLPKQTAEGGNKLKLANSIWN